MTDRDRLDVWNKICIKKGWAKKNELDKWLISVGIRFSPAGSIIPENIIQIDNKYNAEMHVRAAEGELLATLVLQVMTGMLVFPNKEVEKSFWDITINKFNEDYNTKVPNIIIPKYLIKKSDADTKKEMGNS